MMCCWKQRTDQATTSCIADVVSQVGVENVDVLEVNVMREDSSGSRVRADSRTNYGQPVKSPPGTEHSSDLPESKCNNATPVFLLHDHVPTRNGMKSGVPPMRLLNSLAIRRKTRTRIL